MEQFFNFVVHHWALWLMLIVVLALLFSLEMQHKLLGIPALSTQEVTNLINHKNGVIVDVRETSLFNYGHIIGAINVPAPDVERYINELKKHKEKPLVFVDASGQQHALNMSLQLKKQGFEKLSMLKGGMASWQNEKLPVVKR